MVFFVHPPIDVFEPVVEETPKKVCNNCTFSLELDKFSRDSTKPDGLRTQCRECISKKSRAAKDQLRQKLNMISSATPEDQKKAYARGLALKVLVENHYNEFEGLVHMYYENYGLIPTKKWVSM